MRVLEVGIPAPPCVLAMDAGFPLPVALLRVARRLSSSGCSKLVDQWGRGLAAAAAAGIVPVHQRRTCSWPTSRASDRPGRSLLRFELSEPAAPYRWELSAPPSTWGRIRPRGTSWDCRPTSTRWPRSPTARSPGPAVSRKTADHHVPVVYKLPKRPPLCAARRVYCARMVALPRSASLFATAPSCTPRSSGVRRPARTTARRTRPAAGPYPSRRAARRLTCRSFAQ